MGVQDFENALVFGDHIRLSRDGGGAYLGKSGHHVGLFGFVEEVDFAAEVAKAVQG